MKNIRPYSEVIPIRRICVFNNKGGVAKTTTAVNLSAGLSRNGKKVLLIDIDPQNNVSLALRGESELNLATVLSGKITLNQAIVELGENLDLIASGSELSGIEKDIVRKYEGEDIFGKLFANLASYDFLIFDCAPSMGILNEQALRFCTEAVVPTSTDFFGMDALNRSIQIIQQINSDGGNISISKIVPTMYDKRNKICKDVLVEMQTEHPSLVTDPIHVNSKLKEAPKKGKSIFAYAKSSSGAKDYGKLTEVILAMKPKPSMERPRSTR